MKAAFIGGGSLRLLPIFRGIFATSPQVFENGEIRLIDLRKDRAEAVARGILACPEFASVKNCRVSVPDGLDDGLPGLDLVYITMGARTEPIESLARFMGAEYGYFSSDQLTVNGAFLSLRLGFTILNFARKMEKLCPNALMLLFPNPVSVYSHMVNTQTKIRALGICGGFSNHRVDLTRLCFGKEELDTGWDVVAAGVNHLSFILRGSYKGEDLYGSLLPRCLKDWKNPVDNGMDMPWCTLPWQTYAVRIALNGLYTCYEKYKTLIFSTELDGMAHLFLKDALDYQQFRFGDGKDYDPTGVYEDELKKINLHFDAFCEKSKHPENIDWNAPGDFALSKWDLTIPILRALAGLEPMRIVASRPNYGAVKDMPYEAPLEYSMDIYKDEIKPVEDLYIPSPFKGLISSLAEFQTLQSQALVAHDPQIFAHALEAYPVNQFSANRNEFFRKMFDLHKDFIDPVMFEARKFFED
ncbi:MAG: hypothetical protein IKB16_13445 [Lentisphaeria bacterium]|nr:hypothetical protein [Lentisphaeria bacterium]